METPLLRAARADDREAVCDLCANIWPDSDHIPAYWDRFVGNPASLPHVIEVGDRLAGFCVLDILAHSGWFHSLRVSPGFRQQGLATLFLRYFIEETRHRGLAAIRLATSPTNEPMHRLCRRHGLQRRDLYRFVAARRWSGSSDAPAQMQVRPLGAVDLDRLERFLDASVGGRAGGRTQCLAWTWDDIDRPALQAMVERGWIQAYGQAGTLDGVAFTWQEPGFDDAGLFLSLVEGSTPAVTALGLDLRRQVTFRQPAGDEEFPLCGLIRDDPGLLEGLRRAGFETDPEEDLVLFELVFPQTPAAG